MRYGEPPGGHELEDELRRGLVLAAEAVYGLYEAAVEVGAPPYPGLLGPDVPPHHSAIPAAAAAAAHLLVRQRGRRVLTYLDDMELSSPGPSKERTKLPLLFPPSCPQLLPRSLTSLVIICVSPAQSCRTGKQVVASFSLARAPAPAPASPSWRPSSSQVAEIGRAHV